MRLAQYQGVEHLLEHRLDARLELGHASRLYLLFL